ncbi:hypothetical protein T265_04049 [Opisthorchis viverrini]|uniref:Uncharacterized protein n=1 Tax=Opisthorchis viverrini TaxID=6198 RepID=A0A074YVA3_OPIVI|nr:hypothetical protein T265_04049 [Opisthorchis viverrini]XP_009177640.1 hypothetical protein T265_12216 [Opisthorchis viverrini]KER18613.1 hypothetical protein T265_12216 [Opisthorchis viverrini]KER29304.1 hypothetical protein T265_04049 [Opisthorchis viverrini]
MQIVVPNSSTRGSKPELANVGRTQPPSQGQHFLARLSVRKKMGRVNSRTTQSETCKEVQKRTNGLTTRNTE